MQAAVKHIIDRAGIEENREAISAYFHRGLARGLSPYGLRKNLYCLLTLSNLLGKPFDKATIADIERIMEHIERSNYSPNTKNLFRAVLKAFYGKADPRISWIKVRGRIITPKLPQELITRKELYGIMGSIGEFYKRGKYLSADEKRALLIFLYDSAIRPREFMALGRKHLVPDEHGMFVMIPTVKTAARTIYLVESRRYMNDIPFGKYTYHGLASFFSYTRRKMGMEKRFYPYILRHSRLTELARLGWNEAMLCKFAGWVQGSVMPRVYIHLSETDLKNMMLKTIS